MTEPPASQRESQLRFIAVAHGLFLAAGIILVMIYARDLLVPLAAAVVVWLLLNALATWLQFLPGEERALPGWLCLTLSIIILAVVTYGIGQLIASSIADMTKQADAIEARLDVLLKQFASDFGLSGEPTVQKLIDQVDPTKWSAEIFAAISGTATTLITVLLYVAFLLVEQRFFTRKLYIMFPDEDRRNQFREVLKQIGEQIRTYLLIKTWLALINGVTSWIVMWAVGLEFAVFFAFLSFLGYYIPTIGGIVATALPVMFALVQFDGFTEALIILIASGGLQVLIANLLEPRLMSRSLNISMFVMVLALFVFGAIWGIAGMFLSAPIIVILMIVLWNIPSTRPIAVALSETGRVVPKADPPEDPPSPA